MVRRNSGRIVFDAQDAAASGQPDAAASRRAQISLDLSTTPGWKVDEAPMTVTGIARRCGLSRTAVLYYEAEGLLRPASRTQAGYRRYGEAEIQRLEQICS
jgi:hypothetical protein